MHRNVKRLRAKNYSPVEERILENLVAANQDVIRSKSNDAVTWRRKVDAWKQISAEFALQTGMERPWKALREKYINTRRLCRQRALEGSTETRLERDLAITAVSSLCEDSKEGFGPRNTEELTGITGSNADCKPKNLVQEPQIEPDYADYSKPYIKEEPPDDLEERMSPNGVTDERMCLLKLQQDYYRNENSRAAEKHKAEMAMRGIEIEQLTMEVERQKLEMEKRQIELQGKRLKNDLLELEVLERRGRINGTEAST